jgi:cytochrome c5
MVLFAQQPEKTVVDGVYTEAQALRGEAAYTEHCAHCHGANLDGIGAAPMLYSSRFIDRWREDSLLTLYEYTAANMPQDAGAKRLPESDYLDIISYLLYVNDLPAGTGELTLDRVRHTLLVGPEGPKPLPPSTTVRVVGCLAQAAGAWTLTDASAPARVRKGDTTSEAELTQSKNTPLGSATFRLPNLGDDHDAATLTKQVSRKVQVKGVLNSEGAAPRVSVLSFEALDQPCSH